MKQKCKIDVAILGARMHYAVPKILDKHGLLHTLFTDFYIGNKQSFIFLKNNIRTNNKLIKAASGRVALGINNKKVVSFDAFGLKRWYISRKKREGCKHPELMMRISKEFNQLVINKLTNKPDIIYAFNVNALEIFDFAKSNGIKTVLEQASAPKIIEQNILYEELSKCKDIVNSFYVDLDHPYIEIERSEWNNSDLIIAPSQFVLDGLEEAGADMSKCTLVSYGVNINDFKYTKKNRNKKQKLNIFFAGEVGIQKGAHYLLQATKSLPSDMFHIKLAGNITFKDSYINEFGGNIEFLGKVPRTDISDLYEWADVFIFPSLCEGSATVIYEAIASGVPVITTKNSGSIIEDRYNGLLIPIRDSEAIVRRIEQLYEDTDLYKKLVEGVAKSRDKVSIEHYQESLMPKIIKLCKGGI